MDLLTILRVVGVVSAGLLAGIFLGHRAGFAIGVELGEFARGQLLETHLSSVAGHDAEPQSQFAQEFGAARRSRSEDEPWQVPFDHWAGELE